MAFLTYRRSSLWFVFLGCSVVLFTGQHVSAQVESEKRSFDISEGYAIDTLQEAAQQVSVEFIFSADLMEGVRTSSIRGEFRPIEAFNLMLAGTSLAVFQHEKSGVYIIRKTENTAGVNGDSKSIDTAPMNQNKPKLGTLIKSLFVAAIASASQLDAQTTEEKVFELSPFTVDSSSDKGYRANNTLAGSRLNSELSDTAAAISPFTRQLLDDLGAENIEDVLRYSNNVTRLDESELAVDNQALEFDFQFNFRGLPASRSRNYFIWELSSDNFNVGRIDESRGPNSILFGVGSAGGVINTTTKRAIFANTNSVQFVAGSHNKLRSSVDFNRVLIDDRLSIRLNAVTEDRNGYRLGEFRDQDRIHFTTTFKPTKNTTIRGEYEAGEVIENLPRGWLGIDNVSLWDAAGRPARADRVLDTAALNNRYIHFQNDGETVFTGRNQYFQTNTRGLNRTVIFDETELINYTANGGGPDGLRDNDYSTYSLFLEQRFNDAFNVELSYNHQSNAYLQYDAGGNAYNLRGDVSAPGVSSRSGELFYESFWSRRTRDRESDTFRATASYEVDFGEKIGKHRFALMAEERDQSSARDEKHETYVEGADPSQERPIIPVRQGDSQLNARNRVWRRNYVTEGDFSTYHIGSWKSPATVNVSGTDYVSRFVQRNQNIDDDDSKLSSLLFSMQNFWFGGKIVTTYGYREDDIKIENRGVSQNPDTNIWEVDYQNPPDTSRFNGGSTQTVGIVAKPTRWLSLLYNDSDNQGLPDVNRNIATGTFASPSKGKGRDMGFMFNLFEGRVFARIARYESSMIGLTAFGNRGNVENRNNRILGALLNNGDIDASEVAAHTVITNVYTFGRDSDGNEAELTANITDNWSLRLNFSLTDRVRFNIMPENIKWFGREDAYWQTFAAYNDPAVTVSGGSNGTIAEESSFIRDNFIANNVRFEGLGDAGTREKQGNLFTNYRFTEGALKGFNIGGGVRYLGANVVGVDIASSSLIMGNDKTLADFLIGYRTKAKFLGPNGSVRLQLNVSNVFDEREPTIALQSLLGVVNAVSLQRPREFKFSATFNF